MTSRTFPRPKLAALLVVTLLANSFPAAAAAPARAGAARRAQGQVESSIRRVDFKTNDIVYNRQTRKIYASVPSAAGPAGNSIAEIDPATGGALRSSSIGSEPGRLALSDDGNTMYAALDGAASVRRFDIPTYTPGLQFVVGTEEFSGAFYAFDLAVAPGNPNVVAVARHKPFHIPGGAGVAIFEGGVQRPTTAPGGGATPFNLAFSASESTLYGSAVSSGGLRTLAVNSSGVTQTSVTPFEAGGDIQFDNGLVYTQFGKVINPSSNTLLGSFAGVGSGPFVVDSAVGRAYYITGGESPTVTLRAFDINTFLPVGELSVGGLRGSATSLVRWGANGLAFRTTGGQLFFIQTTLIPSPEPVPAPTPTPPATPTPTPAPVELSVRRLALNTKDLVYNPATQVLYASLPSSAGPGGNSIATINPDSGVVGTPVFVGSEPTLLAISDDAQYVYVSLDGAAAVRRFDTATQTAGLQFALGNDGFTGPLFATDISVMPGRPGTVAVSRCNRVSFPCGDGVAVYDDGVRRAKVGGGGLSVEFSDNPARLYSNSSFSVGLNRINVAADGVTYDSSLPLGGPVIRFDGGLLYSSNGQVIDPEAGVLKGTFTADNGFSNHIFTTDAALGRAFFLSVTGTTALLRVYDTGTFLPVGQVTIPDIGFTPNPGGSEFSSLVRWGTNGLAFRTTTHVMLIQTPLVSPAGSVPAPTPTPSPTPSPGPTPEPPTFVRQINLPVNDLVLHAPTQKIYASVPSAAGAAGNSITSVDPTNGAAGTPVFIGSEPTLLALSDDNHTLYASLEGAQAVRRFDINTQAAGQQFFVAGVRPSDIEVMPGSPQTVAVAGGDALYLFDNGVRRAATTDHTTRVGVFEFSASPSRLYAYNTGSTGFNLYKLDVGASDIGVAGQVGGLVSSGFGSNIDFVNGLLYVTNGRVIDPEAFRLVGTFPGIGFSSAMAIDPALGRAFFLTGSGANIELRVYDTGTFLPVAQVTLPVSGTPTKLVRWGTNGLAFRSVESFGSGVGKLYVIQSALVSAAAPVPTGLQLSSPAVSVGESTHAQVNVTRTGDLSGASSVDYATGGGTASERSDYTTASGTLHFAPGEKFKQLTVLVTDDAHVEGQETLNITLSNVRGAELAGPGTAVLTIVDNDFGTPSSNPVDNTQFFVRQHYADFLNRAPDSPGLSFWTSQITSCGGNADCREIRRINVSAAFFLSIEFQQTGFLVHRLQRASFATLPRYAPFLRDTQEIGRDVVVNSPGWEEKLEGNRQQFIAAWVERPAFKAAYDSLSDAQYVDALIANTGAAFGQAERDALVGGLGAGAETRATVLRKVAENPAFAEREKNPAFVLMQYFGYLRRNPDDAPDGNTEGYNFWLQKLNNHGGDFVAAEMVKSFLVSGEYRSRFGPN